MSGFYKKAKKTENISVLGLLNESLKLNVNFNLVKNGADVNTVFKHNPIGLDAYLVPNIKVSNDINLRKMAKEQEQLMAISAKHFI